MTPAATPCYNLKTIPRAFIDLSENLGVPSWFDIHGSMGRVHIEEEHGIWELFARQGRDREQPPMGGAETHSSRFHLLQPAKIGPPC